ncbi:hypothetical protein CANINC_000261 [Pichia inconspicua]|uniref:Decapping nuclease n=1 Tax=Pichia inconspicua TaxID=52247 RepID=A0A4T0X705_9ASCO|nr:hypothetical protein CANINC_000261 [[Candida] inconspicua]
MKESFRPGPDRGEKCPNMKEYYKQFKHHVLDDKKPITSNLQWTLLDYETKNNLNFIHDPNITEIYCHNGLFTDLMTKSHEKYRCIKHNSKLFISGTSTRKNQDRVLTYIGPRFETFVTNQAIPKHDKDHYKALLEGNWGEWNYKSVVEIDAYKFGEDGKKIEDMTEEERLKSYAEIKLCSAYNLKMDQVKQIKNKEEFLTVLSKQVKAFKRKIEKWLFQSYFGRQDTLVIGVRNSLYKLMCYEEIDMFEDLLPFVKEKYPDVYAKFLMSPEILEGKFEKLFNNAPDGEVMEFLTNDPEVILLPTNQKYVKVRDILLPQILKKGNGRWENDRSLKLVTNREETKESLYFAEGEAEALMEKLKKKHKPKRRNREASTSPLAADSNSANDAIVDSGQGSHSARAE